MLFYLLMGKVYAFYHASTSYQEKWMASRLGVRLIFFTLRNMYILYISLNGITTVLGGFILLDTISIYGGAALWRHF